MKIGIKYCGGCRSSYNRKKFVDKLKAEYSEMLFESAREDMEYDVIILVNGCKTACANHSQYKYKKKLIASAGEDYKKINAGLYNN